MVDQKLAPDQIKQKMIEADKAKRQFHIEKGRAMRARLDEVYGKKSASVEPPADKVEEKS